MKTERNINETNQFQNQLPKPKASVKKFFNQDPLFPKPPHITKEGEYINPKQTWLLKEKFVPKKLKKLFKNAVVGELSSKSLWKSEEPKPLKVVKYIEEDNIYVLEFPDGKLTAIKREYYDYLKRYIKNFWLAGIEPSLPLIIFSGNEKAGLVATYKL